MLQGDRPMRHSIIIHEYDESRESVEAWRYDINRLADDNESDMDSADAAALEALYHARTLCPIGRGVCVYSIESVPNA